LFAGSVDLHPYTAEDQVALNYPSPLTRSSSSLIYSDICFSAAICSSCRTTRQQQLSVSRMEKQDEKREK